MLLLRLCSVHAPSQSFVSAAFSSLAVNGGPYAIHPMHHGLACKPRAQHSAPGITWIFLRVSSVALRGAWIGVLQKWDVVMRNINVQWPQSIRKMVWGRRWWWSYIYTLEQTEIVYKKSDDDEEARFVESTHCCFPWPSLLSVSPSHCGTGSKVGQPRQQKGEHCHGRREARWEVGATYPMSFMRILSESQMINTNMKDVSFPSGACFKRRSFSCRFNIA